MSNVHVRSGDLRHVINIQSQVSTGPDSMGSPSITWTNQITGTRAEIRPLRGDQFFAAQQMASIVDTKVRIRYRSGIKPNWRVVWGSRVFLIVTIIDPEMRKIFLDLMCREIREGAS